jgi:site-specific recombinase, phage integrase family
MSSRLITKVPNRPNFYFFDTALKDGKKLTVKFCLFTKDLGEAVRLANSIKAAANEALAKKITTTHTNSKSLRALINIKRQNERCIKQNGLFLDASEYKELSQEVIAKFYNLIAPEEKLEKELKTLLDASLSPKEATPLSFKAIAKRYVQTECLKLKSSDKTKGYYIKTGKLLDEFFKEHQGKEFSYSDAENFQTKSLTKRPSTTTHLTQKGSLTMP